ncbi:hypothetical protein SAMN05428642_10162 [Flaviramulus basaltis]|uniref:SpoIIAA-like n=1 Tax=Flaviramulus basaltis TaxID=369401 RepID=A0A1K2I9Z4_9FLAO|nr:hypothetical protein [Flaviramulus basaltis]SFZ89229.1 hypothetical protein SAMN05428642_10162 [Flaviramulus basaltis]
MKSYKLSFGTITILKNDLAEVIVDDGVVMDEVMVDEYHDFLLTNLDAPFSLLINKTNSYSYTYEAQKSIVNFKKINAMGVLVESNAGIMSTETLLSLNKDNNWNVRFFRAREDALVWLNKMVNV